MDEGLQALTYNEYCLSQALEYLAMLTFCSAGTIKRGKAKIAPVLNIDGGITSRQLEGLTLGSNQLQFVRVCALFGVPTSQTHVGEH